MFIVTILDIFLHFVVHFTVLVSYTHGVGLFRAAWQSWRGSIVDALTFLVYYMLYLKKLVI